MEIAITGIGLVTALGTGAETNRRQLQAGRSALRSARMLPTKHHEWPIGEVPLSNEQLRQALGLPDTPLSRNVLLGMTALQETLADAGLDKREWSRTPLINGTTVGGMDLTEQHFARWRNGDDTALDLLHQHEAAATTAMLAEHFGLQEGATVSTACSSALNAMIHGAGLLRTGQAKQVIAGGTEAMTLFHLNGFAALGILSEQVCRPFSEERDGINLGEGAAYLMLEEAEQARRRGAHIYGYLAGYANRCDAYHQTASSPEGDGALEAMRAALQMAGLAPEQVPYINAHGTATPNNDASELRAIERLFGERLPRIESTKPLTGHTTSASGSIEAIFTLMRMEENGYDCAISNAFGFGGNDSSIVLRGAREARETRETRETRKSREAMESRESRETRIFGSRGELDYKPHIPAMQARRMTALMRQLVVVAQQAIEEAGEIPDGIVVGTRWGGMIPTAQLLNGMMEQGERDMSPALFMNSTHNSAAGTLARLLQCKGYNTTVVSRGDTLEAARQDALLALQTGEARSLLVCSIDETEDGWQELCRRTAMETECEVKAQVICCN